MSLWKQDNYVVYFFRPNALKAIEHDREYCQVLMQELSVLQYYLLNVQFFVVNMTCCYI